MLSNNITMIIIFNSDCIIKNTLVLESIFLSRQVKPISSEQQGNIKKEPASH